MNDGKWVWGGRYWRFVGVFASVLKNVPVANPQMNVSGRYTTKSDRPMRPPCNLICILR